MLNEIDRLRKQLWAERITFGLVIVALLVVLFFTRSPGQRVYALEIGEEPKVFLASKASALRVQNAFQDELKQKYGDKISIPAMTVKDYPATDERPPASDEAALTALRSAVKPQVPAAVIYVDGKPVVALQSHLDAQAALDEVKVTLAQREAQTAIPIRPVPTNVDPATIKFKESVEIKAEAVSVDILKPSAKDATRILLGGGESAEKKPYVVQKGDMGTNIAKRLGISFNKLSELNPGVKWNRLQVGQELNTTVTKPLVTIVTTRQLTLKVDVPYTIKEIVSPHLAPGSVKVQQRGQAGKKEITANITYENGREVHREILHEKVTRPTVQHVVVMSKQ